jgi:hypothetical protein
MIEVEVEFASRAELPFILPGEPGRLMSVAMSVTAACCG